MFQHTLYHVFVFADLRGEIVIFPINLQHHVNILHFYFIQKIIYFLGN